MTTTATLRLVSDSVDRTALLGEPLGASLRRGDIVLLRGAIGTGKTTLARGILRGAGCQRRVRSPSFTLVNEHRGTNTLVRHCDFMRLKKPAELDILGWEEWLVDGALVVEWPQVGVQLSKLAGVTADLHFEDADSNRRNLEFWAHNARGRQLLSTLRHA